MKNEKIRKWIKVKQPYWDKREIIQVLRLEEASL